MRIKTDDGPRTIVFSLPEDGARLLADTMEFDAIAIQPEIWPRRSVMDIVKSRVKDLDKELAMSRKRRQSIKQVKANA